MPRECRNGMGHSVSVMDSSFLAQLRFRIIKHFQNLRQNLITVHRSGVDVVHVVKAHEAGTHPGKVHIHNPGNVLLRADGYVARAHGLDIAVIKNRLGDDAGRIGKVNEPGIGASSSISRQISRMTGIVRNALAYPRTSGLLADDIIFQGNGFIFCPGIKSAHAELGDDKVCASDG